MFSAKPGWALWCLRPAVAFRPVAEAALCVILTSGTLSPTDSLEGELGCAFPVKVEAPHIVPRRQLHVEATAALGDFTRAVQESDKMPHNLGGKGEGFFHTRNSHASRIQSQSQSIHGA